MRPDALSMVITSPAVIFSLLRASIIFCPRSYTASMSVVFIVILPVLLADPSVGLSIWISTTSPSMISASSLMRTPIDLLNACVRASVLLISMEKSSLAARLVKGVSSPRACAIPIAMAVLPVPGWPARRIARPAILPCLIISKITPAALRAWSCPTRPCEFARASRESSKPRPRMCECAPIRSMRVISFTSAILTSLMVALLFPGGAESGKLV
mmetsp:Transcript_28404/g.55243  ORF Transcript_28404/g.55243 Transcript_28404/m.55243 type:complete len:214 (-) Transcript_28404:3-644(-)